MLPDKPMLPDPDEPLWPDVLPMPELLSPDEPDDELPDVLLD
ncbi:hypothetical protein [Pontibacter roseus]|nr:hypothetical protein [Pontibacter roseus]